MSRGCGNCGTAQGPFDRFQIGDRKTGGHFQVCRIPSNVDDGQKKFLALQCNNRRALLYKED